MKNEEIVRALRCISTAGGENACEHCPYWKEEEVPEEERPIYGAVPITHWMPLPDGPEVVE